MTREQSFDSLLEGGSVKKMVQHLQSLSLDERKALTAHAKSVYRKYMIYAEIKNGNSTSYTRLANDEQQEMLLITALVLFNQTEFSKLEFSERVLEEKILGKVLPWYQPNWLSDYINGQAGKEFLPAYLPYSWMVGMTRQGWINPSKELIARILPAAIYEQQFNEAIYVPKNLGKHAVTISEHLWILFEIESAIYSFDRWLHFDKDKSPKNEGWLGALLEYTRKGKIDRKKILRESLLASNRNFNKLASGWFSALFIALAPDKKELLMLQEELISVLHAPHSKAVNTALGFIKTILDEPSFSITSFLDATPVLLSNDTKSIVATTIQFLERISKTHVSLRSDIASLTCQALIHADEDLQAKAAQLIAVNADPGDEKVRTSIAPYLGTINSSTRAILSSLMDPASSKLSPPEKDKIAGVIAKKEEGRMLPNALPVFNNLDDLLFLASQAFDNNETWHIDLLPATLIRLQNEIKGPNIAKLEPALQRALKMMKGGFRTGQGYYDHMLGVFFIDYCIFLVRKHPKDADTLKKLFDKSDDKAARPGERFLDVGQGETYLSGWKSYYNDPYYFVYREILMTALDRLIRNDLTPLLSTPTHDPAWIDPVLLVERWTQSHPSGKLPSGMDAQVAFARMAKFNSSQAISEARSNLKGEALDIFLFALADHDKIPSKLSVPNTWLSASLSKKPVNVYEELRKAGAYRLPFVCYSGQYQWLSIEDEYESTDVDPNTRKPVKVMRKRKEMTIAFPPVNKLPSDFDDKLSGKEKKTSIVAEDFTGLYDCMRFNTSYISAHENDIARTLSLLPDNPDPFLAVVAGMSLRYPTFWQESDKRAIISTLQLLQKIWGEGGDFAHAFLGSCMIQSDKTVVGLAAEIWMDGVNSDRIDTPALGNAIGKHLRIEFAPLKRFTDLITQRLLRISTAHNEKLQQLVERILAGLPVAPVTNLKKLLDIYQELISLNQSTQIPADVQDKLSSWKRTIRI